jgi:uncharacterized protein (TIRG00374 family)
MSLRRGTWWVLAKLAVLAVALTLVVHFNIVKPGDVVAALARPGLALSALALIFLGAQLSVLRWHLLLHWQGSPLRFSQTWQICYISYFLGSFLPGASGSDALRALYMYRECPDTRVPAFLTILADRIAGLVALLMLVLGLAAAIPAKILSQPALMTLVLGAAVFLLASVPVLLLARLIVPRFRLLRVPRLVRNAARFRDTIAQALAAWRGQPHRVALCLGIGVLGHLLVAAAIVVLAHASGLATLSRAETAFAGTLAVLANQLPLTPGGLGVGESSFAQIARLLAPGSEAQAYGSVIFTFRVVTLVSFLPGAVALLIFRHGGGQGQAAANARSTAETTASTPASSSAG